MLTPSLRAGIARPLIAFISPDGRHYVYETDKDDQFEVWVSPLGESDDAPLKVSIDGGMGPGWSPTGDSVFYRMSSSALQKTKCNYSSGAVISLPVVWTKR